MTCRATTSQGYSEASVISHVPDREPHAPDYQKNGEHHVTIPRHDPLRIGTLSAILVDVAQHFGMTRDELARRLF